ncbi:glucosamine-6-phosphate deaminase [Pseudocitrobacter corydidari]|uniref:Glucosamine-6-phosphate deaminase n=1 Tax=Pseudocitrobacter corydidari TaxID=2891570 RepID=A0ABY3SBF3_9ENTR|nr:glucosamine-6-phosphate deaminase [Pseudocitrobacter corydidari]UGS43800.1 Glucosamine-6-phosphate deaminase [Pseudocitrobacter corydidari]
MDNGITEFKKDNLTVLRYGNRQMMGEEAGRCVAEWLRMRLSSQRQVRMIFAAAPSQNEFLATLARAEGIDWSRVTVFHMDEYIGLSLSAPQRFSHFLQERLFNLVKPGTVHLIPGNGDPQQLCQQYGTLLSEAPIDAVCLGIGENGHLAFNDPPVADFADPKIIKHVELDDVCRQQQVNDGCFPMLDSVPTHALTLTIPTLLKADYLFCIVPGATKREAVIRTLNEPVSTRCPATILRQHANCLLFTDVDACPEVPLD